MSQTQPEFQPNPYASQRRFLIGTLVVLVGAFAVVLTIFIRYLLQPAPIADIVVPDAGLKIEPHYLFSIYGLEQPVGVAVSHLADRIYVSESGGQRMIKAFDGSGKPLSAFTIPHTAVGERAPVYLAVDKNDHVYASDRQQHALYIFDRQGQFINTLLGPRLSLTQFVSQQSEKVSGQNYTYNLFQNVLYYTSQDGKEQSANLPFATQWSPLGVRIDNQHNYLFVTDVNKNRNSVCVIAMPDDLSDLSTSKFNPGTVIFGDSGQGNGEFMFPNSAMTNSHGQVFVADGNNGRISVWDRTGKFMYSFGRGAGEGALSLPRGIFIDQRDRLFVVDAVGQDVKVFNVSGAEPVFLYAFGDFGTGDGLFNYPNDIAVDFNGRVYIVDRENNRIEVWSF